MKIQYKITEEAAREIKEYRKKVKDKYADRRLYAVQLRGEGMKSKDICEKLDADKRQLSRWSKQYCEGGIEGLLKPHGGRYHENMTFEEEEELLNEFKEKAGKGQIIEVSEIKKEYEKRTKPSKSKGADLQSTASSWLEKSKARSRHLRKASPEAIEASKKLTLL